MANSNFKCPNCESDNIQSVPVAYKAGTSSISGNMEGGGIGVAVTTGGIGPVFGVGGGEINAIQKTALAETIEPPTKFPLRSEIVVLLTALLGLSFYGEELIAYEIATSFLLIIGAYIIFKMRRYLKDNMEYLYMEAALIFTWYISISAMASTNFDVWMFLSWLLLVTSAGFALVKHIKYNKIEYPEKLAHWKKLYICHKCGNVFEL